MTCSPSRARARPAARGPGPEPAPAAQGRRARLHGHAHRPVPDARAERGDAHIIRNAGGLATDDALRSLSASQRLLGTEEIVVVMHDGCGLQGASEDELRRGARRGRRAAALAPRRLRGRRGDAAPQPRAAAREPRADRHRPHQGLRLRPRDGALREVQTPAQGPTARLAAAMRAVTFQAPGVVSVEERPEPELIDREDAIVQIEAQRRVRLGPAHLPRARPDRARLHDRPRVRRHGRRGRRRGQGRRGRRPRARLLPDRLRRLLLLPARPLPPLRELAHVRARRDARLAPGHPGRDGADPERRPRPAAGARGHEPRRGAVRRRRDGHRLPRGRRERDAARRRGGGARPRTRRAVRGAGRAGDRRRPRVRDRHRPRATGGGRVLRRPAPARAGAGRESAPSRRSPKVAAWTSASTRSATRGCSRARSA